MEGAGKGTISNRGEEFGNCLAAVLTAHSAAGWGEAAEEIACLPCAQPESHRASVSHNLSSLFLSSGPLLPGLPDSQPTPDQRVRHSRSKGLNVENTTRGTDDSAPFPRSSGPRSWTRRVFSWVGFDFQNGNPCNQQKPGIWGPAQWERTAMAEFGKAPKNYSTPRQRNGGAWAGHTGALASKMKMHSFFNI